LVLATAHAVEIEVFGSRQLMPAFYRFCADIESDYAATNCLSNVSVRFAASTQS